MSVKTIASRGKRLQVYVIVHEPLTPCLAVRPLSRFVTWRVLKSAVAMRKVLKELITTSTAPLGLLST